MEITSSLSDILARLAYDGTSGARASAAAGAAAGPACGPRGDSGEFSAEALAALQGGASASASPPDSVEAYRRLGGRGPGQRLDEALKGAGLSDDQVQKVEDALKSAREAAKASGSKPDFKADLTAALKAAGLSDDDAASVLSKLPAPPDGPQGHHRHHAHRAQVAEGAAVSPDGQTTGIQASIAAG